MRSTLAGARIKQVDARDIGHILSGLALRTAVVTDASINLVPAVFAHRSCSAKQYKV